MTLPHEVDPAANIPIPSADPGIPHLPTTASFWHSQPSNLHSHRTTPTLPSSVSTIIIGSGMAGAWTAHHLRSPSTLMLEARNTCYGATGRNGGHCKPALYQSGFFQDFCRIFGTAETVKRIEFELLNLAMIREYVETYDCAAEIEFEELPSAAVYFEKPLLEDAKRNLDALKMAAPHISEMCTLTEDPAELRDVLRTPTAVGAVLFRAAKLWPYKLVSHILTRAIADDGLNLQTNTPALSISRAPDGTRWEVSTPRGTITASRVIVAANAHTPHLLPQFSRYIYPVRAQMAALSPPKSLRETPLTHSYSLLRASRRTSNYLIQHHDSGALLLGGGRPLEHNSGVGLTDDGDISPAVARHLREFVPRHFAADDDDMVESFIERFRRLSVWDDGFEPPREPRELKARYEWTGIMGFSADEMPFVGAVPGADGLWVVAGFEGHGMALAAGCAKALATMVMAESDATSVELTGLFEWFPRGFVVCARRLGVEDGAEAEVAAEAEAAEAAAETGEWVLVKKEEVGA